MSIKTTNFKPGDKVTYTAPHGGKEVGKVKMVNDDGTLVWVVYHCNNEWDNYANYTGAATRPEHLTHGWFGENIHN